MTYLGDLNKTQIIDQLFQVALDSRDGTWKKQFLDNVADASFRCQDPQVITGPDGFPYFALLLPEPYQEFQCFVIKHMLPDFILAQGVGIVMQPAQSSAQWVFSYGDLVNFYLRGEFYSAESLPDGIDSQSATGPVLLGQPAENLLPQPARKIIRAFLNHRKITAPRILLMTRQNPLIQELVFEIDQKQAASPEEYNQICSHLSWFLPRHYRYSTVDLNSSFSSMLAPL